MYVKKNTKIVLQGLTRLNVMVFDYDFFTFENLEYFKRLPADFSVCLNGLKFHPLNTNAHYILRRLLAFSIVYKSDSNIFTIANALIYPLPRLRYLE